MSRVQVRAVRWQRGWELEIDGETHTQVATLDTAVQQVRDYLDTVDPDVDHSDWEIVIVAGNPGVNNGGSAAEISRP